MKNRYRGWILLLFCLILLVSACSRAEKEAGTGGEPGNTAETFPSSEEQEESVKEDRPFQIGVSIYRYDDNFMKLYREELKKYLEEEYGATVTMRNARGSQEEQNKQVKEFLEAGCDAVIVNLVDTKSAAHVADLCHEAGTALVFINREAPEDEQERWERQEMAVACVGTDSGQAGTYQGEIILETENQGDFNGDGTVSYVMIMGERGNRDTLSRTEYSVKALENAGLRTEKLFGSYGNWKQEEGRKLAERALKLYGRRIEVIFCNNDAMAEGAFEAIDAAGRTVGKDIYLVGVDALEDAVTMVKDGRMTGTVLNDHTAQSHTAADVAVKMIQGEETDKRYLVDYIKITTISTNQKNTESEE